jgi:hypothetical protein
LIDAGVISLSLERLTLVESDDDGYTPVSQEISLSKIKNQRRAVAAEVWRLY